MSGFIGRYENDKENKCREELFFFFFCAVFDILLRLLRDAPKPSHHLHPDRARVLSQVLPADGALSRG